MIRVLVVDDSPFFRRAIARILEKDPEIKVIGFAKDGEEAVQKVLELSPDVVTLDIEMPKKNGLEALKEIMEKKPTPVIMVSALTKEGAEATIKALELGALDFIPKGIEKGLLQFYNLEEELIRKVKQAKGSISSLKRAHRFFRIRPHTTAATKHEAPAAAAPAYKGTVTSKRDAEIVAIGSSTGGPPALQTVISHLSKSFKLPIVIAQHMPPLFTGMLAEKLNTLTHLTVKEAEDREPVREGYVYVAPGGKVMEVESEGARRIIRVKDAPPGVIYKPNVDLLYSSVARAYGGRTIGVILTGMGKDGCEGAKDIKQKGGVMIAEHKDSCVVYGMPRCVVECGLADYVAPVNEIPDILNKLLT